jgi:uncharacterized protein YndB with AHSA1/START domain
MADHLITVQRSVAARSGDVEQIGVILTRRYAAAPADVWAALTEPDRLVRWFLPVKGDLRVGGSFQFEGNAGGEILACEPPERLRVTCGGDTSIVKLRLTAEGDGTRFELDHAVPVEMAGSGAGALWVGPGWDGAVIALGVYLEGAEDELDEMRRHSEAGSPENQEFGRRSTHLWATAVEESGTATAEQVAENVAIALGQYAPDLADGDAGDSAGPDD